MDNETSLQIISKSFISTSRKKLLILIVIVVILLLIGLCIIIAWELKSLNNPSSQVGTSSSISTSSTATNPNDKIEYSGEFIDNGFSISYPVNLNKTKDNSDFAWDWTLTDLNSGTRVKIDFSAEGQKTLDEALGDWVTLWNGRGVEYNYSTIATGTIGIKQYKIFSVTENSGDNYLISVIDVGVSYGGRGYLAIQSSANQRDLLESLISSIKSKNSVPESDVTEDDKIETSNGIQVFISPDLGIEFQIDQNYVISRIEDKVAVTPGSIGSQYVEVLHKEPAETVNQAIERLILKGYDKSKCWLTTADGNGSYPGDYTIYKIDFPKASGEFPWYYNAKDCPSSYTYKGGGASYFLSKDGVEDRFAFIQVGSYAVMAGDTPWQYTFRFL